MITYEITLSKQFRKDYAIARCTVLFRKIDELVALVSYNPFQTPPSFEKLQGEVNTYSRRINQQHRLVYQVDGNEITFLRCWRHYE